MKKEDELEQKVEDDLDFDFGAKKKKKKKGEAEAAAAAAPAEAKEPEAAKAVDEAPTKAADPDDLDEAMFGDMKKKKKKKAEVPEQPVDEAPKEDLDLAGMKKKKKKAFDMDAFEKALEEDGEDGPSFGNEEPREDYNRETQDDGDIKFSDATVHSDDPWAGSDRDYTYSELLDRAFRIIRQANPELEGGKKKYTMIPPQVVREGTKKTLFANLSEICKRMHRQPDHVITFLFAELGTTGSVDGSQRLVIKGRFQPPQIENVLRSYILEYVTCKICKSPDTILTKENRLTFMQCQSCGAKRSVANIKSGFSAQVDRRSKAAQN